MFMKRKTQHSQLIRRSLAQDELKMITGGTDNASHVQSSRVISMKLEADVNSDEEVTEEDIITVNKITYDDGTSMDSTGTDIITDISRTTNDLLQDFENDIYASENLTFPDGSRLVLDKEGSTVTFADETTQDFDFQGVEEYTRSSLGLTPSDGSTLDDGERLFFLTGSNSMITNEGVFFVDLDSIGEPVQDQSFGAFPFPGSAD